MMDPIKRLINILSFKKRGNNLYMNNGIILKEDEVLEIRSDRIFHDMFNEYEMDTIEWLVMKILDCSYSDIHGKVKVGGSESPALAKNDKGKRLDLIVYYKDKIINIELNNNTGLEYVRNANYISNRVINSRLIGDTYEESTQGILVNLNWFKYKTDADNIDLVTEMKWEYPSLSNDKPEYFIKFINVNLEAFKNICYNDIKEKDLVWKLFTINKKTDLNKLVDDETMLEDYRKKLERLSKDEEYCRMIWDERIEENLRKHEDFVNGKHEGKIEGKIENRNQMIMNMYHENVALEIIAKVSETSVEEVEKIINSNLEIQNESIEEE